MARKFITLDTAADLLAVDPKTIRRAIAAGHLTGYRVGAKSLRLDAAEVDRFARPIPTVGSPAA